MKLHIKNASHTKKITAIILAGAVLLLPACGSMVKKEEIPVLKQYEQNVYVLKKEIQAGESLLKSGSEVRLLVVIGDDWVKVYGYPAKEDLLKTNRVLIKDLYLFEEDFPDEEFNMDVFVKKFDEVLKLK